MGWWIDTIMTIMTCHLINLNTNTTRLNKWVEFSNTNMTQPVSNNGSYQVDTTQHDSFTKMVTQPNTFDYKLGKIM
jgi:hypothetical protein